MVAASRVGTAPEGCVVVEDARAGVEAGKRAGMRVVGIAATYTAGELLGAGADAVLEKLTKMKVYTTAGNQRLVLVFN